jgi:hypothetical protein
MEFRDDEDGERGPSALCPTSLVLGLLVKSVCMKHSYVLYLRSRRVVKSSAHEPPYSLGSGNQAGGW